MWRHGLRNLALHGMRAVLGHVWRLDHVGGGLTRHVLRTLTCTWTPCVLTLWRHHSYLSWLAWYILLNLNDSASLLHHHPRPDSLLLYDLTRLSHSLLQHLLLLLLQSHPLLQYLLWYLLSWSHCDGLSRCSGHRLARHSLNHLLLTWRKSSHHCWSYLRPTRSCGSLNMNHSWRNTSSLPPRLLLDLSWYIGHARCHHCLAGCHGAYHSLHRGLRHCLGLLLCCFQGLLLLLSVIIHNHSVLS